MNNSVKSLISFSQFFRCDKDSHLFKLMEELGFFPDLTDHPLTSRETLQAYRMLVLGDRRIDLEEEECRVLREFIEQGNGLLVLVSSETMKERLPNLKSLVAGMGIQLHEYHNYPPTYLQVFHPHYLTANLKFTNELKGVAIKNAASLTVTNGARAVAFTKATRTPVIACAESGKGRVVVIGAAAIFSDTLLDEKNKNNRIFAENTFRWLTKQNVIEITDLIIPAAIKFGQNGTITLIVRNNHIELQPDVECTLATNIGASIADPVRTIHALPPESTARVKWSIRPETLGSQELRLIVKTHDHPTLYFNRLFPDLSCIASGYLTLEIRNSAGEMKTTFETGEHFTVEGAFHWSTEQIPDEYHLELQLDEGLVECGCENEKGIWHVQAIDAGTPRLTLKLAETSQEQPATITIIPSFGDQLQELRAAYEYPLDVEIAERLEQVDPRFGDPEMKDRSKFVILPAEDYVKQVYDAESTAWLQGVLTAAHREQWYNLELVDLVLTYLAPTYLPNVGAFVPYAPQLASHLAQIHPAERKRLEYGLFCLEDSDSINIKQNIAAYLLHEKYGHGFFYTQTRLGQQLAILRRHGFPARPHITDEYYQKHEDAYKKAARLIIDSSVVVNEGFGAWLEITFLPKLVDHEVRQAAYVRQKFLINEGTGLYQQQWESDFFSALLPRFDSRYREGFEYLNFITQEYNPQCALRMFGLATQIDFDISEDDDGEIVFGYHAEEFAERFVAVANPQWHSHVRLQQLAEILFEHSKEVPLHVRKQYYRVKDAADPLECVLSDLKLKWTVSKSDLWEKHPQKSQEGIIMKKGGKHDEQTDGMVEGFSAISE